MHQFISTLVMFVSLVTPFSVWADQEVVGRISRITTEFVEINNAIYPLWNGASNNMRARFPEVTECWAGGRTTCGTLAGIGYADKARVTVRNGVATRIQVLELQQ